MRGKSLLVGFWVVVAGVILAPLSQVKMVSESATGTESSSILLILGLTLIIVGASMLFYGAVYKPPD